jgi:hypothetical protein
MHIASCDLYYMNAHRRSICELTLTSDYIQLKIEDSLLIKILRPNIFYVFFNGVIGCTSDGSVRAAHIRGRVGGFGEQRATRGASGGLRGRTPRPQPHVRRGAGARRAPRGLPLRGCLRWGRSAFYSSLFIFDELDSPAGSALCDRGS